MAAAKAKVDPSRMCWRLARPEDLEAVRAINDNIYDGKDYLLANYLDFIKDPKKVMMVGQLDGVILVFAMAGIIDDDKTALQMATRVNPKYSSQGIWSLARIQLYSLALQHFPTIQREAFTTPVKKLHLDRIKRKKIASKYVLERPYIICEPLTADRRRYNPLPFPSPEVQKLTNEEILQFLGDPENQWKFFPYGRLVVEWKPFRLLRSNFDSLIDIKTEAMASMPSKRHLGIANSRDYGTFSFFTRRPISLGMSYYLDVYGEDEDDIIVHALEIIGQAFRTDDLTRVICFICVPVYVDFLKVQNAIKEKSGLSSEIITCSLFETPMEEIDRVYSIPKSNM